MINSVIIMDDLLQSGNIVTEDSRIEEMGCHPYGYFRYIQGYTSFGNTAPSCVITWT